MARKPELSPTALHVLALLPQEPVAWALPNIAQDILGKTDTRSLARILAAMREAKEYLYVDMQNTRPYGRKKHYGIRADRWDNVQRIFQHVDVQRLINDLPLKAF